MTRFWNKVDRSAGEDACWPWTAACDSSGYGLFRWHRQLWKAHRFALVLTGQLPLVGQHACHSCDNPKCCNPIHLRWDTPRANVHERDIRGRWRRGRGNQKLTGTQADALRERFISGIDPHTLADDFGISVSQVYRIARGTPTYV